ncbi:rod shape-determining protein MreC [Enterococcus timonensis]|uniref:rod shape-determining protein MreC n=1 Tax=Enterococcus timonensis TaxID=1852364 RepID=UPI0008D94796|nr:rod shape-determining protein MreC [Enterococcus timonensis]
MKKFNPSKKLIITLIVAIIVVAVVSLTAMQRGKNKQNNLVQSVINDTTGFFDRALTAPVSWIENGVSAVSDLFVTYDENKSLKARIDAYDNIAVQNKNQEKEITELKQQLELDATLTSFETINGNVISRSPDSWQDILIIDKGSMDGLETNMPVMAQKGLIGRVIEVNTASAKVELLTSENQNSNHFPVKVSSEGGESFGLLSMYDSAEQSLVVTQLTGSAEIKAGDLVQTSGLGGNSPANLVIGTVAKVKNNSFGLDRQIYITPYAQMYDINVVTVVKRLVGDGQ